MRFSVRVFPGSRRPGVGGTFGPSEGEVLVVRVATPAVEGRANQAVVKALAAAFSVRPGAVRIVGGATSRLKLVEVDGASRQAFEKLLSSP